MKSRSGQEEMDDRVGMALFSGMVREDNVKNRGTAENAPSAGYCSVCRQEAGTFNAAALDILCERVGASGLKNKIMIDIELQDFSYAAFAYRQNAYHTYLRNAGYALRAMNKISDCLFLLTCRQGNIYQ